MNKKLSFRPRFLWVDLEMSGLDPKANQILEFACVITDENLKHQREGPHLIIHADKEHLDQMDEWNTTHHKKSGLYTSALNSPLSTEQAEVAILTHLIGLGIKQNELTIAGNSVHQDKLFLFHHMPKLNNFLFYRILDVSSIKIAVNLAKPGLFYQKKGNHRAVDDIFESIGEMQYYLTYAFK